MIKLTAIGHLGKDATVNNVNGKTVINFSVAHSEKYKDHNGNEVNKSIWVDCSYWVDRTTVAQYLKKGTQVYVEGQPDVRLYKKQDGTSGASLALRVHSVQLLGSSDRQTNSATQESAEPQNSAIQEPIDDLPF
jgi:single-strand DNA-binding protein